MSRCFSYPPPGFEIDSIKLRRERDIEKKLKKEKRKKEKKQKEKTVQLYDASKDGGNSKRKRMEDNLSEKNVDSNLRLDSIEEPQEKSTLTEEQGLPSNNVQTKHGSPESSLDSHNKRRKISAVNAGQLNSGNIIRIKLPLAKSSGSKSIVAPPVSIPMVSPKRLVPTVQQFGKPYLIEHHTQPEQSRQQIEPKLVFGGLAKSNGSNSMVAPPVNVPMASATRLAPKEQQLDHIGHLGQHGQLQLQIGPQLDFANLRKSSGSNSIAATPVIASTASAPRLEPKEQHFEKLDAGGQLQCEKAVSGGLPKTDEDPCSSGRNLAAEPKVKLSRHSRRVAKLERKFTDVMGRFKPLPLQYDDMDSGDQDWLFGSGRRNCHTSLSNAEEPRLDFQVGCYQPRAVYLADLNTYQLPYVVPF